MANPVHQSSPQIGGSRGSEMLRDLGGLIIQYGFW